MERVKFDIASKLNLIFRVARDGSKTLSFYDVYDAPFDISEIEWILRIGNNIITLTPGDGLTVSANQIVIDVTEEITDIADGLYFWELFDDTNNKTWLCGNAYFVSKEPVDGSDTESVIVNTEPDIVRITISNSLTITEIDGGTL
jgi:hypothetical protein